MPAVGSTIAAGGSLTIDVTFEPTSEGSFIDELGLETTGGNSFVGLSGSAGSPGALKVDGRKQRIRPGDGRRLGDEDVHA